MGRGRIRPPPRVAAELVRLNVDVIVTHSTLGARAAKQATSTIPVVFAAAADPIEFGLVPSLAHPGGNLTGSTFFVAEIGAKRVELIKEAIPTLTRLAVLVNPANPTMLMLLTDVHRAASALGVTRAHRNERARGHRRCDRDGGDGACSGAFGHRRTADYFQRRHIADSR